MASSKPKRDKHGRFKSKASAKRRRSKKKGKARARRMRTVVLIKARSNPRRKRKLAENPAPRRRRKRKLEENGAPRRRRRHASAKIHKRVRRAASKRRRNPLSKKFRARVARTTKVLRARSKKAPKRSLRRRALSAQLRRASAIASLAASRSPAKKIRPAIRGLQHAMMTRSNPGLAGVIESAKILAPQALVGGAGLVAITMAGKYLADMIVMEKDPTGASVIKKGYLADEKDPSKGASALGKYMPAISTAGLSLVGFVIADKVAPRYRGAVMIGGMIGAAVQAIMASVDAGKPESLAARVQAALLPMPGVPAADQAQKTADAAPAPAAPAAAGFGEYTTVGSGIFHGFGEYTTVGAGGDNATEFAADSLRGLDDASSFAPGEGGVLSGGIFK